MDAAVDMEASDMLELVILTPLEPMEASDMLEPVILAPLELMEATDVLEPVNLETSVLELVENGMEVSTNVKFFLQKSYE